MFGRNFLWCCFLLLLFTSVDGQKKYKVRRQSTSKEFDVLIFTQRWPQTVCFVWKESSESHTCILPKDEEWTIHGIWPSQYNKLGPQFCNSSLPFDAKALKPLESQLLQKWIDVEAGKKPYSFWRHEWEKHGTCAATLERLNTEFKYFQEGLDLLNAYDMTHVLAKANINPGNQYTIGDVFHGIQRVLGKRAEIMCVKNNKSNEHYIFEIRICFDKSLQLIDCDGVYEFPSNCNQTEKIMYPGSVPQDYHVIQI